MVFSPIFPWIRLNIYVLLNQLNSNTLCWNYFDFQLNEWKKLQLKVKNGIAERWPKIFSTVG